MASITPGVLPYIYYAAIQLPASSGYYPLVQSIGPATPLGRQLPSPFFSSLHMVQGHVLSGRSQMSLLLAMISLFYLQQTSSTISRNNHVLFPFLCISVFHLVLKLRASHIFSFSFLFFFFSIQSSARIFVLVAVKILDEPFIVYTSLPSSSRPSP